MHGSFLGIGNGQFIAVLLRWSREFVFIDGTS